MNLCDFSHEPVLIVCVCVSFNITLCASPLVIRHPNNSDFTLISNLDINVKTDVLTVEHLNTSEQQPSSLMSNFISFK